MKRCKTCKHWKSQQAELGYSTFNGICTCHRWQYNTVNGGDIAVLDRENRKPTEMGTHRFESQNDEVPIGQVDPSRYCFVTEEEFGCIHHKKV